MARQFSCPLCSGVLFYEGVPSVFCTHCTNTVIVPQEARQMPDVPAWHTEVLRLAQSGQVIMAIKLYREQTNAGLRESKDAVEAMLRDEPPLSVTDTALVTDTAKPALNLDGVRQALQQGQKIMAIKIYRDLTGLGLAEAKGAVEDLAREMTHAETSAEVADLTQRKIAPPVVPRAGCFSVMLLFVPLLVGSALVWWVGVN